MKKNIKMMVTAMVLALTIVFQTATPALAGGSINAKASWTTRNEWNFQFRYYKPVVYVGQVRNFRVTCNIWGNTITYKSSNPSIATVDQSGNVTGRKAGKVTIIATDGVHTAKLNLPVKAALKAKSGREGFNYGHQSILTSGKTYTLKTLAGSPIKKITSKQATINGTNFTMSAEGYSTLNVTLKDGQKVELNFYGTYNNNPTHERAKAIIKAEMPKYGITMNSSDVEKAMFAYNWVAGNIVRGEGYIDHKSCRYCSNWGKDCGIINHVGDCDVQTEAVLTICEVVGLWAVPVCNNAAGGGHAYCGVRVDGEWYLMDTGGSEPWDFVGDSKSWFLNSSEYMCSIVDGVEFKPAKNACKDIVFTSTRFDTEKWEQYRAQRDAWKASNSPSSNDDFWND